MTLRAKARMMKVTMAVIILAVVVVAVTYQVNAGTWYAKQLDVSCLDDDNTTRIRKSVESSTVATVTVKNVNGTLGVTVEFDERPDVRAHVYLDDDDIIKLDNGDQITVRGKIKYVNNNDSPLVIIGEPMSVPLFIHKAKLVSITKYNERTDVE